MAEPGITPIRYGPSVDEVNTEKKRQRIAGFLHRTQEQRAAVHKKLKPSPPPDSPAQEAVNGCIGVPTDVSDAWARVEKQLEIDTGLKIGDHIIVRWLIERPASSTNNSSETSGVEGNDTYTNGEDSSAESEGMETALSADDARQVVCAGEKSGDVSCTNPPGRPSQQSTPKEAAAEEAEEMCEEVVWWPAVLDYYPSMMEIRPEDGRPLPAGENSPPKVPMTTPSWHVRGDRHTAMFTLHYEQYGEVFQPESSCVAFVSQRHLLHLDSINGEEGKRGTTSGDGSMLLYSCPRIHGALSPYAEEESISLSLLAARADSSPGEVLMMMLTGELLPDSEDKKNAASILRRQLLGYMEHLPRYQQAEFARSYRYVADSFKNVIEEKLRKNMAAGFSEYEITEEDVEEFFAKLHEKEK